MNKPAIFATQQIFQKDAEGKRKFRQVRDALLFKKFKAVNIEGLSANVQLVASAERIARVDGHSLQSFRCAM